MNDETCWGPVRELVKRVKEASIEKDNVILVKDLTHHPLSWYSRFTRKLPATAILTIKKLSEKLL